MPPHLGQLVEHVQRRRRREAVGADRDRHTGRVEVRQTRRPGTDPLVAARARDHDRARAGAVVPGPRRSDAPRGRQARPAEGSRPRQGTARDRTPARATRPSRRRAPRASSRIGPPPVRRNSISSGDSPRWTVSGATRPLRGDLAEQRRRHGIGRVRDDREPDRRGPDVRFDAARAG